jgi:hypothetical protein
MLLALVLFLSPYALVDIPHAVPAPDADKLKAAGVATTDDLLSKAASPKGRKELSKSTGLDEKRLRSYAEMADLLRIGGVGPEMVRLFAAAHVHTTKELAGKDAKKLYDAIMAVNDKQKITQNPPDPKSVAAWIDMARQLPQVLR